MNKYAFDLDDDNDGDNDDDYGPAKSSHNGKSAPPKPMVREAPPTSFKAPTPMRYGSSLSLGEGSVKNTIDSLSVKKAFADRDLVTNEENLGNNFYATPWVPPDVDKAALYRMSNIYKEGKEPMGKVALTEDLGIGIGLNQYFQFSISIAVGFLFMTILALPVLVFAYSGDAVLLQDQDIVGLYALTIGNIGYNPSSFSYVSDSTCTSGGGSITPTVNQTCIVVNGSEYTMESVSLVITALEILQALVFFIMIVHIKRRMDKIVAAHQDSGVPSITDYAVHVTNIPKDTTVEEIIEHFSNLYELDTVDWRGRLPVEDAAPVDSVGYSGSERHVGTWVAECTVCAKMGKVVDYLHKRKEIMKKLYDARARMKMYGPKTPHVKGFNPKKYAYWESVMLKIATKVDKLNEKIHMNYLPPEVDVEKGEVAGEDDDNSMPAVPTRQKPGSRPTTPQGRKSKKGRPSSAKKNFMDDEDSSLPPAPKGALSKQRSDMSVGDDSVKGGGLAAPVPKAPINGLLQDAPALAAFVCFEYNESFARCLEDYSFFSYFPMRLCYPRKMLFKGHHLTVRQAPEPDQIVWENIEVNSAQKGFARLRTLFWIAVALIIEYALFAAAADMKSKFFDLTPPAQLCQRTLPQLYAGSEYNNDTFLAHVRLTRSPMDLRAALDAQCADVLADSYYALYTYSGVFSEPIADYSVSACNSSAANYAGLCPVNSRDSSYCPCLTNARGENCQSMGCADGEDNVKCVAFSSEDISNCYCRARVDGMIEKNGQQILLSWLVSYLMGSAPDFTDECEDVKFYLSSSNVAIYLAVLVTLITNKVLKGIIIRNSEAEHHISFAELDRAIASKIFLATYLNMSIIILLAFGSSTQSPAVFSKNYLFSGPYQDFTRGWFGQVGFYLVVTFILMNFPQFWNKYYHNFVTMRFKKFTAYKEAA